MNLRGRLPICIIAGLMFTASMAYRQSRRGDVMITIMNGKLLGIPASGSRIEEGLGVNETVADATVRGQTGFAQTAARLLGFSSELRRWTKMSLGVEERVERHRVLPRLIVVQTNR